VWVADIGTQNLHQQLMGSEHLGSSPKGWFRKRVITFGNSCAIGRLCLRRTPTAAGFAGCRPGLVF
jgi:hypothetical protein